MDKNISFLCLSNFLPSHQNIFQKKLHKTLQSFILLASVFVLGACEVEDNNDPTQVDVTVDQASFSVTLSGKVVDVADTSAVNTAQVSLRLGTAAASTPIAVNNGFFELDNLPPNSDFVLIIEDTNSTYLRRVYFGRTQTAPSSDVFQDLGQIQISVPETVSFAVLDADSGDPITGLQFIGLSQAGSCSFSNACGSLSLIGEYDHESTYDDTTGRYSIELPENLSVSLSADIDLDNNGDPDWLAISGGFNNGRELVVNNLTLTQSGGILLTPTPGNNTTPVDDLQLRISVVDDDLTPITGAELTINDSVNNMVASSFDNSTEQYILDAQISGSSVTALLPTFTTNGITYDSASIQVRRNDENNFQVSISGSQNDSFYLVAADTVLDIALKPRTTTATSFLQLVTKSTEVDSTDNSFRVFYSAPIALNSGSIQLSQINAINAIPGDADPNDLVLPGTTLFEQSDIELPTTATLSLNDTLLTIVPTTTLSDDNQYRYMIDDIVDVNSGIESNINGDQIDFSIPDGSAFDINQVRLDNNNYTTNGVIITAANTAGIVSSASDNNSSILLVLPRSIIQLESLTFTKRVVTNDGVTSNDTGIFELVSDGSISSANNALMFSTADNETILNNVCCFTQYRGTAIADGKWYIRNVSESLSDNTGANTNEITFDYAYETKTGVIQTGTLTLPVL